MFDPKDPKKSLKEMRKSNRQARIDQLDTNKENTMIDLDRLRQVIKETLTPTEYQEWERAIEEDKSCQDEQPCLVAAFFRHQETLPPARRSNACMISCPCRKCSPGYL
jgi:hypothetical protein